MKFDVVMKQSEFNILRLPFTNIQFLFYSFLIQRVSFHCGMAGNEEVDVFSKAGSKMKLFSYPVIYRQAQIIIL